MKVVYKEKLNRTAEPQDVVMASDAQVLHLADQHGDPTIWFLTDPGAPMATRRFQYFGTGHTEVPDDAVYVGTSFYSWLVLHLFEIPVDWNAPCKVCGHYAEEHPHADCKVFLP
jgi:hypothetical protein